MSYSRTPIQRRRHGCVPQRRQILAQMIINNGAILLSRNANNFKVRTLPFKHTEWQRHAEHIIKI